MRLKQSLGVVGVLLALSAASFAGASQLVDVGVQSKDNATTLTIRANGAFTHTEYRPTDNLLLVDLAGVSAAKMANKSRELHGQYPGIEAYHVVGYKGASGTETTRVELTLAANTTVNIANSKNGLAVSVLAANSGPAVAAEEPANRKEASNVASVAKAPLPAKSPDVTHTKTVKIQNVSVVRGKDGLNLEIKASGAIAPRALKLTGPDRVVVDIPNAVLATRQKQIAVNSGAVKSVRMSHYQVNPSSTRIVVDLNSPQEYELANAGTKSTLKLHGMASASAIAVPEPARTSPPPFREVANTSPMPAVAVPAVMVQPSYTTRPATATEQAMSNITPVKETPAARAMQAAAHFSQPNNDVPVTNANASMKPAPGLNLAALQQAAPAAPAAQPVTGCSSGKYNGEPISVNLKDVDLRDFFRLIHEISGLNVVLDPQVRGSLTIVLDDVPWDQALSIVLKNNGLDCQLEGNVLRIATTGTIKKEADDRRLQLEAQALAVDLGTISRYLNYAASKDIVPTIKNFLSARGSVIADDRTNSLIISDIPSVLPNVDRLIKELDRKTQEVEIEARVVAASRNFARDIGTQLGIGFRPGDTTVFGGNQGPSSLQVGGRTPRYIIVGSNQIPLFSDLGVAGTGSAIFSNFTNNYRIDFVLSAAESRGLLKVLSRPRIVTQNNVSAFIRQGSKIPVVTGAQLGGPPTVTYIDAFLRLTVKPQITAEGTIFLNVDVENTTPDFSRAVGGQINPSLLTQQATTQVLVTDGGTVVIGGVIQTTNNVAIAQFPLLGSIPVFGNLFKRRSVSTSTAELIFFITPKIIQT